MQLTRQMMSSGKSINIIHFVHRIGDNWRIVCMPGMQEFHKTNFHPAYMRSDDPRAVTCPGCKSTEVYKSVNK